MSDWKADQYVADVLSGKQIACHWVKAACQRHVDDLAHGHERGLHFDEAAAVRVLKFFTILKHSKGEWAGQPIRLEPWQQFILWCLFGWKRADGTRRFRTAYLECARKNGKSTLAAGVGLYLLSADNEPGAEVYSASTKRDQSKIVWSEAARMVKKSPVLKKRIVPFRDNLHIEGTASKFEPLGADSDTLDGLNVHAVICDEVHAWKSGDTWDILQTATGARRQPMMFAITTAGFNRHSLCWQLNERAKKVLDRLIEADDLFGIIYTLDDDDDWQDEATWIKSSPNLGVSKKWDTMREKCEQAKQMPSRQNAFKRLELDIWTTSETRWIPVEHWRQCGGQINLEALRDRLCYGGLDLSSTTDLTALLWVFPPEEEAGPYVILPRFFCPEENILKRAHDDRVPYDVWKQQGYLTATPGNSVDYDYVFEQIKQDRKLFKVDELAFDRWGAARVVTVLQSDCGFTVDEKEHKDAGAPLLVEFGQGFASMSPPMKDLERLILAHKLAHGNNPVLNWMADNVVATLDAAGNIKPDKQKSREKIDGIVAMIMALDRAMRHQGAGSASVYEKRGLRVING